MRIYENDNVKVNLRPRFDFDSYAPVQGVVLDEVKEKVKGEAMHYFIEYAAAIVVALAGFALIDWWIHGGFHTMMLFVGRFAPWLMRVMTTGQL